VGSRRPQDDPLALDRETMRRLGYRVVDLLVDQEEDVPLRRAIPVERVVGERLAAGQATIAR
jgi:hypothetical protein